MPYINRNRSIRRRHALHGFGDFNDESQCSSIPAGDAYRKPGNYCATPDGGYTTFNPDGTTYTAVTGAAQSVPSPSVWTKIGNAITAGFSSPAVVTPGMPIVPVHTGLSTTTAMLLAGAGLLAVVMLTRDR